MTKKKKSKLAPAAKLAIKGLNLPAVEMTMAGLKPFLQRSIWIGTTNYYGKDVVNRLERSAPTTAEHKRHLAQYIAASVALHANDGWSYLGRAVSCMLAGDKHRSLHLAYYAELRAAMSLLASNGLGVFNYKHFYISGTNTTTKFGATNGTHILTWLALQEWSRCPASGVLFSALVRPEGLSLDDWFSGQGGATVLAPQAKDWFLQWGMDLSLATKDREARNESSYRPDGVPTTWELSSREGLDFVRDMWSALEPGAGSSFEQIDRYILRLAVERHHFSVTSRVAGRGDAAFVTLVNSVVDAQSLAKATEDRLKDFLLRRTAPTDPDIFRFSAMKPGNPQTDAFAVMARAVLLLRVATGAAHTMLDRAGFDASVLEFWWQKLGETRGLWTPGEPPDQLADLWADVEQSLRDVADVEAATPDVLDSFYAISEELPGRLSMLASHERVALWGLCPS